jgi:hypothetical protein
MHVPLNNWVAHAAPLFLPLTLLRAFQNAMLRMLRHGRMKNTKNAERTHLAIYEI